MPAAPPPSGLLERLSRGATSTAELQQALGVSQPTLSRALRRLEKEGQVLRIGVTRGARYARRRSVSNIGGDWPLYSIDAAGRPQLLGTLHALAGDTYALAGGVVRDEQWWNGLPWFLQDARPAGFLGRALPALYPELQLPARVIDWTDDHVLVYLTQRGTDSPGDLILGTAAMDRFLASEGPLHVRETERHVRYPEFARATMLGRPPGSSAHGEHPKFTTVRLDAASEGDRDPPRHTHVLVKFSPPLTSAIGRRWGDLLHAEHLAHRHLIEHGIAACRSQVLTCGDRVFLECERFDRSGERGRLGTVTLLSLDAARYGQLDSWSASARRLMHEELLDPQSAERIRLCDAFGALIGNTDRHFGNVTLFDRRDGAFELAPVYDMLPMLFAPQEEQIVARAFEVAPPSTLWLDVYDRALVLARGYWERLAAAPEISPEFRRIAGQCAATVSGKPAA